LSTSEQNVSLIFWFPGRTFECFRFELYIAQHADSLLFEEQTTLQDYDSDHCCYTTKTSLSFRSLDL